MIKQVLSPMLEIFGVFERIYGNRLVLGCDAPKTKKSVYPQ